MAIQVDGWNNVTHVTGTGVDISYQYDGLGDMVVRNNARAARLDCAYDVSTTPGSR